MSPTQWMVDEKELRVIHYTLGPLKPWDWWTSWLVKPVDVWQVISYVYIYIFVAKLTRNTFFQAFVY